MAIPEYQFKLQQCQVIAPNVKHFVGEIETNHAWTFTAGQFITILFEHDGKVLRRSYSVANPPHGNKIEFTASFVEGGPGSAYLFSRNPGDAITVTGPFGRLILKPEDNQYQRFIFIGTSTGITPYRSMLPNIATQLKQHPHFQVEIIQGVQKFENILFSNDFDTFCQQHHEARFSVALSRQTEGLAKTEFDIHHGHVQDVLMKKNPNPSTDLIYLCGNPKMIDDTFELLKTHGFSIQQIIREKYLSR